MARLLRRLGAAAVLTSLSIAGVLSTSVSAAQSAAVGALYTTTDRGLIPPSGTLVAYANGTVIQQVPGADYFGDASRVRLKTPIVGIASSQGHQYWLAAADGGVFSYGLPFFGSAANMRLNQSIVGIGAADGDRGYWPAAADGGVFTFGAAPFAGSAVGHLARGDRVVGMTYADGPYGGYALVTANGAVLKFPIPYA